ncbi:DUF3549 family protein [Vibrio sp. SCSIO 43136]|uniref:DUF3549 family protein n=1 Tax=Vibrio sp. SCSIO 43136 TaxID=2819101 RepID=UPI00207580AE|nr:DUF3549 family protein [Vibrio sp. SCSIO 43136]USD65892.1 DUF3549 family protein [Vibrio sp. SCSIO 43136]
METFHTLSQLLSQSGNQYLIYDLSRKVSLVDNKLFESVEQAQQPYPFPIQRHAHIAIAYWNEQPQPWIWFLKFPLDERGLFKQADIGNFIKYVLEAMGTRISGELSEEQQEKLSNNPYTFKPAEDKLAVYHSVLRAKMKLPASQYYEHAQHYFGGGLGWDKWQTVGLQGITDIAARLSDNQNGVAVRKSLNHLPAQPLYALLGALEHIELPAKLAQRLNELATNECSADNPDLYLLAALARALSGSNPEQLASLTQTILQSARLSHQEVLIALAGRCWSALKQPKSAELFLLRLAQTNNQDLFNQLFADLVMIPELRMVFLPLLHGAPSPELAQALLNLQQNAKGQA